MSQLKYSRFIFSFLAVMLFGILFYVPADAAERINVEYKHSEVSFIGDDSFVTGRYTTKPLPDDHIWEEMIHFTGGIMRYYELRPGYFYTGGNQGKHVFVRSFNNVPFFKKKGHSISETDIIELSNETGDYYLASSENEDGSCGLAKQFSGDTGTSDGLYPVGTKLASVYFCRSKSWGSKFKLNKFIQDIMDRARYDEGKLNKMRAAGRK